MNPHHDEIDHDRMDDDGGRPRCVTPPRSDRPGSEAERPARPAPEPDAAAPGRPIPMKTARGIRSLLMIPALALALSAAGCTNAEIAQQRSFGVDHRVTLYSGGQAVRTFISSGKVLTESDSDGWYFMDKTTRKLVRLAGAVVVEAL